MRKQVFTGRNTQHPYFAVFNNSYDAPMITVRKYHPKIKDEVSIELDKFDFQSWHSYCFLFTSQPQFPYPGGYINLTNKAYIDGKLVKTGQFLINYQFFDSAFLLFCSVI